MHRAKHVRIRGQRRDQAAIRKLSRAVIALAQAQAETDAALTHIATRKATPKRTTKPVRKQP